MNRDENMFGSNSPQNLSECSELGELVIDESLELKVESDKDDEPVYKTMNNSNIKTSESINDKTDYFLPELIEEDTSSGFKITSIKSIPAIAFNNEITASKSNIEIPADIKVESNSQPILMSDITTLSATTIPTKNSDNPREKVYAALISISNDTIETETDDIIDNKRLHDNSDSDDLPIKRNKIYISNDSPKPSTSSAASQPTFLSDSTQKSSSNRRKSLLKPREEDMIFDEVATVYPINKKPSLQNPNKAIMKKVALVRVCADFMLKELGKKSLYMKKRKLSLQKLIEGFNSQFV